MSKKITVVSVDDHILISEAIAAQLAVSADIDLVAQGRTEADVARLVAVNCPNVLILEISLPRHLGSPSKFPTLRTITDLRETYPDIAIIVLTQHLMPAIIREAMNVGVQGYLFKRDEISRDIASVVIAVSCGGVIVSPQAQMVLTPSRSSRSVTDLTQRQLDVLLSIARNSDLSYARQARLLQITETTFKTHLSRIYAALGVSNAMTAVIKSLHLGIISLEAIT